MKIAYKNLVKNINAKPGIDEISKKLFQLGHEHEIDNHIYDIEITPNRGDCLLFFLGWSSVRLRKFSIYFCN